MLILAKCHYHFDHHYHCHYYFIIIIIIVLLLLLLLLLLLTVIINCSYIHSSSQGLYQGGCENTWHMEIYIVILLKDNQVFNPLFLMVFVLLKTQSNENSASQVPNKGAKVLPILLNFPVPPPLPPSGSHPWDKLLTCKRSMNENINLRNLIILSIFHS